MSKNVRVEEDERYPFYDFADVEGDDYEDPLADIVEISDEEYERWTKVMDEFVKVQKEIKKYINLERYEELKKNYVKKG